MDGEPHGKLVCRLPEKTVLGGLMYQKPIIIGLLGGMLVNVLALAVMF